MKMWRALLFLRWRQFRRKTARTLDNAKVYFQGWEDVTTYLFAVAVFLGEPLSYLVLPDRMALSVRMLGAGLLLGIGAVLLISAIYRAVFSGLDGLPVSVPVGDIPFVFSAPVSFPLFVADRLLWPLLRDVAVAIGLFPILWLLARAFLLHPPLPFALYTAALMVGLPAVVRAIATLLYGAPHALRLTLKGVRIALFGLMAAAVLAGVLLEPMGMAPTAAVPTLGLPNQAELVSQATPLEQVSLLVDGLVHALLAWEIRLALGVALVALLMTGLAVRVCHPELERLTADTLRAERRRVDGMMGREAEHHDGPGIARTSLQGRWATGWRAVAWRQLAAYRHWPLATWGPRLLSLFSVAWLPAAYGLFSPQVFDQITGIFLAGMPGLIAVKAASRWATCWQQEVEQRWTLRLMPINPRALVMGHAFWPAVACGSALGVGWVWMAVRRGLPWSAVGVGLLACAAAGLLVSLLSLHAEWMTDSSPLGRKDGQSKASLVSLVAVGGAAMLIGLMASTSPSVTIALAMAAGVLAIAALLVQGYLIFLLSTEQRV